MAYLLFTLGVFSLVRIIPTSADPENFFEVHENINDAVDGEKFFKNVVNGETPKEQPEFLLFTAPFRICNGGCNSTNISNFNMLFPIYVGQQKSQAIYPKIYSRDHENIYSKADHAPFRKSTTRVPFTTCPTFSLYDSEEALRPPTFPPDCEDKVKVSKVDFEATHASKTKSVLRTRKHIFLHNLQNDKLLSTVKYLSNSYRLPKEKIYRTFWPFRSNKD